MLNLKIKKIFSAINKITYRNRIRIIFQLTKDDNFIRHFTKLLSHKSYQIFKFTNIDLLKSKYPGRITVLSTQSRSMSYCLPTYYDFEINEPKSMKIDLLMNTYISSIDDVKIIGGSNLLFIENSFALYDLKYLDRKKTIKFSDQGIRFYNEEQCMIAVEDSKEVYEEGIILSGNFSWNYYHLLYEFIVKFEMVNQNITDISIPILIDRVCIEVKQYSELIDIFNINKRRIIPIDKGKLYTLKKGYHFSCPNLIPPDYIKPIFLSPDDLLFDLSSLDFLRKTLLPIKSDVIFPKRIYISRSNASKRRQFNEDEVFSVLVKNDFKMVYPENHSIAEQVAIFNNAEFIVGGSGAALTNVLFCNMNCKIIVLAKNYLPFSGFSTIARYSNAKMFYLTGNNKVEKTKDIHESFSINPIKLEKVVLSLLTSDL